MTSAALYGPSTVKRKRCTRAELETLDAAIVVAVEADHPVTLRGVFYRVVSAGQVEKTEYGYRQIGRRLVALRRSGRIPYSHITDGTRLIRKPDSWSSAEQMLDEVAVSYRRALWNDQGVEVIVLSEKDAISGVVYPITAAWDVELGITRGYSSVTFEHSIAETVTANTRIGKETVIYQLGDHDPSGADAWRDCQEKIRGFAGPDAEVSFARLAVTPEQIAELNLPTRPTKTTDSRARKFSGESVEVDAIPASILREIVEVAITSHIDVTALEITRMVEAEERAGLYSLANGWSA